MTVGDLCTAALQRLGIVGAGETPTTADLNLALARLNALIDNWRTQRLFTYSLTRTTFTIVSGTGAYTVGTGGTVNLARPVYPEGVRLIDTTADPDLERALIRLTPEAYAALPQKALTSTQPTHYYYNPTYPLGTLTLWPTPTDATLQGAVYTPNPSGALALTDTLEVPPGYQLFYQETLAVHLGPDFERQPSPILVESARKSEADIKRVNARDRDLLTRTPFTRGGLYDINSDQVL